MQIFSRTYRSCHVYKHLVLQNRRPFISSSQSPWSLFRGLDSRGFSCPSGFTSCYCSSSAASSQENLNISDEQIVAELTDGQEKTDTSAALEPQATKEIPEQQLKSKREVPALRRNAAEKDSEAEEFQPKREGLYSLFKEPSRRKKDAPPRREKMKIERTESRLSDKPLKELSPEFLSFLNRLHEEGCLKEANCMKGGELNLDSLSHYYFRGFLKSAAEKFGHSHRLIAK